jgi:hypothetical protein
MIDVAAATVSVITEVLKERQAQALERSSGDTAEEIMSRLRGGRLTTLVNAIGL